MTSLRSKKQTLIKQALMIDAETEKRGRSAEPDEKQMQKRRDWKLERMVARQTAEPTGSAINQTFGCDLLDELINYALQFSLPWDGWGESVDRKLINTDFFLGH